MNILVTSASGANGDGYGKLLAFSMGGLSLGAFGDDARIVDPRGLRVSADRQLLYVNSGDDRIVAVDADGEVVPDRGYIPGLNPGGGNLGPDERCYVGLRSNKTIVAFPPESVHPYFGKPDAITTVREYDRDTGRVVRVFTPDPRVPFRRPRGLQFGPDGHLYCVARDEVVAFDYDTGKFLNAVVRLPRLNGPAVEFFGR